MTVVVTGKGPNGNLLVSDAIVTMKDDSSSHKDCRLKDKIARLSGSNCFCTILGDENILYGIQIVDDWCFQHSIQIDFKNQEHMKEALIASEKFIELFDKQGHKQPTTAGATIYFINKDDLYEYKVSRKDNKYSIDSFRNIDDNEVFINYGGYEENITPFHHPAEEYFEKTCDFINNFHEKRKELSQELKRRVHLNYDFDDRFCGVIFKYIDEDEIEIHSPYKNLSDLIAAQADSAKMTWEFIENEQFTWNPNIE